MGRRLFIPNPFCVRAPPPTPSSAAGEILACYQDRFMVRLAGKRSAADAGSAKARPRLNSSREGPVDLALIAP